MTKHPMADLHVRIPADTMERAWANAAKDQTPHKVNMGRWLTDLIEADNKRRQERGKPAKKGKANS